MVWEDQDDRVAVPTSSNLIQSPLVPEFDDRDTFPISNRYDADDAVRLNPCLRHRKAASKHPQSGDCRVSCGRPFSLERPLFFSLSSGMTRTVRGRPNRIQTTRDFLNGGSYTGIIGGMPARFAIFYMNLYQYQFDTCRH